MLMMIVVTLSSTVSADPRDDQQNNRQYQNRQEQQHHDWSHPAYQENNWHRSDYLAGESSPFKWHEQIRATHNRFQADNYRMERITDREWEERFPGLHSFRWHDSDRNSQVFWYHGHRVTDAVLFYDDADELVSVGFEFNGAFIFIRDDHDSYENRDSSMLSLFVRIGR